MLRRASFLLALVFIFSGSCNRLIFGSEPNSYSPWQFVSVWALYSFPCSLPNPGVWCWGSFKQMSMALSPCRSPLDLALTGWYTFVLVSTSSIAPCLTLLVLDTVKTVGVLWHTWFGKLSLCSCYLLYWAQTKPSPCSMVDTLSVYHWKVVLYHYYNLVYSVLILGFVLVYHNVVCRGV